MNTVLQWASNYSIPVLVLLSSLAALIYVLQLVTGQAVKSQFDRYLKELELRLERRLDFEQYVLLERYKLTCEFAQRLSQIMTNLNRHRHGQEVENLYWFRLDASGFGKWVSGHWSTGDMGHWGTSALETWRSNAPMLQGFNTHPLIILLLTSSEIGKHQSKSVLFTAGSSGKEIVPLSSVFEDLAAKRFQLSKKLHDFFYEQAGVVLSLAQAGTEREVWEHKYINNLEKLTQLVNEEFGTEKISW